MSTRVDTQQTSNQCLASLTNDNLKEKKNSVLKHDFPGVQKKYLTLCSTCESKVSSQQISYK